MGGKEAVGRNAVAGTSPATESCNYRFFGAARFAVVFGLARAAVFALVVAARFAGALVVFAITFPHVVRRARRYTKC